MPRYYDEDDDYHRPRRHSQDSSPRRGAYISGALPPEPSQARLEYKPQSRLYRDGNSLAVPSDPRRPRSVPPPSDAITVRRDRSRGRDRDRDWDLTAARERTPLGKVKEKVRETFTDSSSGLGVGVLGAVIGGLAAHEISDAAGRRRGKQDPDHQQTAQEKRTAQTTQLVTTLIGAAVAGLGANALEKRLEDGREERRREDAHRYSGAGRRRDDDDDDDDESASGPNASRRRKRGTAADYYDVTHGYDYVYDRKISRRRSHDGGLAWKN